MYASWDDAIVVYDIARIIEEDLRNKKQITGKYTLAIGDAELTISPVYCDYLLSGVSSVKDVFLTTAETQRVHRGGNIGFSFIETDRHQLHFKLVGKGADGTLAVAEAEDELSNWMNDFEFLSSVEDVIGYILEHDKNHSGLVPGTEVSVTLAAGNSYKTWFIVKDAEFLRFVYRNIFNAQEFVDVVCEVTDKTTINRDDSICNGSVIQYNQNTERVYEVVTAALTPTEAKLIDQLVNSREISVFVGDTPQAVIITASTLEMSNADDQLPVAKFTWRFRDQRPRLLPDDTPAFRKSSNIFTEQFTREFS